MESIKYFLLIFLHFFILLKILYKNHNFNLFEIKTFLIIYLSLTIIFFISSFLNFYKRKKAKGFLNFSLLLLSIILFFYITQKKEMLISFGEGEDFYKIEDFKGMRFPRNYTDFNILSFQKEFLSIRFEGKEKKIKEKESLKVKGKKIELIKVYKGLKISILSKEGDEIESVLYKAWEMDKNYFSPTTLPYRIYIKPLNIGYDVKIYRNKLLVLKKILKSGEKQKFDVFQIEIKESLPWALFKMKEAPCLCLFLIPLLFFCLAFYDKLKR